EQILLDPPRDLLYVGNAGLSPDQFTKVDVSDIANPKPILRSADFGANGQDFALSPDGARLYFMAGGAPDYEAQIISTSDFSKLADLELGAYPQAVAADASLIYVGKA